ncbi:MAG: hypothetical protein GY884_34635, partial [Proteobacteria bacterium]|nr:hypothetical protein [Pseudomonadota bacterium]
MTIADRLASALARKDQHPNIDLAVELVDSWDEDALVELFALFDAGTKPQRHDAIKVIYEVGSRAPELLLPHFDDLVDALMERDNRILWGTVCALRTLIDHALPLLAEHLPLILDAAARSTVIAKDKTVHILVALASDERYRDAAVPELLRLVEEAATNQFPTYAERAATCLREDEWPRLVALI